MDDAPYPGAGDMLHPVPASDPDRAINTLRVRWGLLPMTRDARLDAAARFSLADFVRRGQPHRVMDEAARSAGWPEGPKPPASQYSNFTEGATSGRLGDFLGAIDEFSRTMPSEGHYTDFIIPEWNLFGFAEGPGGKPCVLWYGYLENPWACGRCGKSSCDGYCGCDLFDGQESDRGIR